MMSQPLTGKASLSPSNATVPNAGVESRSGLLKAGLLKAGLLKAGLLKAFVHRGFVWQAFVWSIVAMGWAYPPPAAVASEPTPQSSPTGPVVNILGRPDRLTVEPAQATLNSPWDRLQLLVSGHYHTPRLVGKPGGHTSPHDTEIRDLADHVRWTVADPNVVAVSPSGLVQPLRDGRTTLTARLPPHTGDAPGLAATVTVEVSGVSTRATPVSFQRDVNAILNRGGCNSGACHGTPTGKGGFHLSLRGWDTPYDYTKLVREGGGRRVDRLDPDASLLLAKPLGNIPHMGGVRWPPTSLEHQALRQWIIEGAPYDSPESARLTALELTPANRTLEAPANHALQMRVVATFADGHHRDVTALSCFSISNPEVAEVSDTGRVVGRGRGEVAVLARYLDQVSSVRLTFLQPLPANYIWTAPTPANAIDRTVFAKLQRLRIPPSEVCSDEVFLRRAYLDACGRLPSPAETRAFLAESSPTKRTALIDALLAKPEFTDFWTLKWADLLYVSEESLGDKATALYHQWLRQAIAADRPIADIAADLLTATGSNHENPAANFMLALKNPEAAAETTAQLFLGVRMQCARCHNHPSEKWSQDDYYNLAAFFAPVSRKDAPQPPAPANSKEAKANTKKTREKFPEKLVSHDPARVQKHFRTEQPVSPRPLTPQGFDSVSPDSDPRPSLARWMAHPDNPFFARAVANRIWFHLLGRGVVEPPDDFRESNPPADDALMDYLAAEFARGGGRLRHLVRTIMTSQVYQLSAMPNSVNRGDRVYFSHAQPRMLTAEQLLDAVCDITGLRENFPKVEGISNPTRAMEIAGSKSNSAFLTGFNRPPRRLACECERQRDPNLTQALQFISGRLVHTKIRHPNNVLGQLTKNAMPDRDIVHELYLATLCRLPTPAELDFATGQLASVGTDPTARREVLEDLLWALLNTKEFLFQH